MRSKSRRAFVEVSPDCFMAPEALVLDLAAMSDAADMLRKRLHDVLGGLEPIMGEDTLLKLCREAIRGSKTKR